MQIHCILSVDKYLCPLHSERGDYLPDYSSIARPYPYFNYGLILKQINNHIQLFYIDINLNLSMRR